MNFKNIFHASFFIVITVFTDLAFAKARPIRASLIECCFMSQQYLTQYLCKKHVMLLQIDDDNWLISISRFMGGTGIFLLIAIILVIVVGYNKFFKNRK